MPDRVIVTDGLNRKALTATRSLGRAGYEVVVGETHRYHPARWSRYTSHCLVYSDPASNSERFVDAMIGERASTGRTVLMPMDDETVGAIAAHQASLPRGVFTAVPSVESFSIARDKARTEPFAIREGVPVPESCSPDSMGELLGFLRSVPGPYVFKPRVSSGSRGLAVFSTQREASDFLNDVRSFTPSDYLIQRRITAVEKVHVCVLYNQGNLVATFTQRILRQYPSYGGPGTFWETARSATAERHSYRMFERLRWHGVAMAEYLRDATDGRWYLMEINPRFWNTLALSVHAGVDFPCLLAQLAMGETIQPLEPPKHLYCQWFFPGDLLNFLTTPADRRQRPGHFAWVGRRRKSVRHVIWDGHDPAPLIGTVLTMGRFLFSREKWRHAILRRPG